jgi:uracil-DNA glycosylase
MAFAHLNQSKAPEPFEGRLLKAVWTMHPLPAHLPAFAKPRPNARYPLLRPATQVVPGEGAQHTALLIVGEQPGNDEDLTGPPLVGPAGRMLDRAIAESGLDRKQIFVTNAVKHFKFEPGGKRRLHKRPSAYEIERCKWWNGIERTLAKPRLAVALSATASRSPTGKTIPISQLRGQVLRLEDGMKLIITIHPSALLRIRDSADKERQYAGLVADLRLCAKIIRAA